MNRGTPMAMETPICLELPWASFSPFYKRLLQTVWHLRNHLISAGNLRTHSWGLHAIIFVDHVLGSVQLFTCDQRESCSILLNLCANICLKKRTECTWLLALKSVSGYFAQTSDGWTMVQQKGPTDLQIGWTFSKPKLLWKFWERNDIFLAWLVNECLNICV